MARGAGCGGVKRKQQKKSELEIMRQEAISIVATFVILEIEFTIRKSCADFESSEQQIKALENKRNSFRVIRVNN